MYIVLISMALALALWVIEAVVVGFVFRKKSWKFHVPTQLLLFVLIWPSTQLASFIVFNIETTDIKVMGMNELSITWGIPKECSNITYHRDPTGRWFNCNIKRQEAINWLNANEFSKASGINCGPYSYKNLLSKINGIALNNSSEYYSTKMEANGAGASSIIRENSIFVCEWFW